MAIHWTLISYFLYFEASIVLLLLVPIISAARWQKIFKSKLLNRVLHSSRYYFYVSVVTLVIFLAESIRQQQLYSVDKQTTLDLRNNPAALDHLHMMRFLAQRNTYITAFSLFLFLVLFRLVSLISKQATLEGEKTAALKQAENASKMAETFLEGNEGPKGDSKAVSALKEDISGLKKDLENKDMDLLALKQQAENTNKEYDRLMSEHAKLQTKLERYERDEESKKDH